jgi:arginyl-tRNA synthetase
MDMTDIFATIRQTVLAATNALVPGLPETVLARVEVSPTRDAAHGDMSTNAAMVCAKAARQPPVKLAGAIAEALSANPNIAEASVAGPGFINLRLLPEVFHAVVPAILRAGEAYGDSTTGVGTRVNVEYVSANPTGPMHVGHCRGAVVGDALANLLAKSGYEVTKEYDWYDRDAGGIFRFGPGWLAIRRGLSRSGGRSTRPDPWRCACNAG